jgi:Zn-dependent protease
MRGSDPTFAIGLLSAWTICVGAASALLHEYGHAWTARAIGWEVVGLHWRWYGVALVADTNGKSDQLWKVALGGLFVTALLALAFLAGTALPDPAPLFFGLGFAINAMLLLTNLVPVPLFDGGHVLAGLRRARSNDPCSPT